MTIQNLKSGVPSGIKIKKGMSLKCLQGTLWITLKGKDIILKSEEALDWQRFPGRAVVMPVFGDAVVALSKSPSLFEEFSLFHDKSRLSGAFAG